MATSCFTFCPIASDKVAVTIAHPALGPSWRLKRYFRNVEDLQELTIKVLRKVSDEVQQRNYLPLVLLLLEHVDELS